MEVLNEIIEWAAGLPLWQQIAVVKVLNHDITDEDTATLADICAREKSDPEQLAEEIGDPLADFKKHEEDEIADGVAIKELHSTQNINAIKDGSKLTFGETGLTVVYGSNAVGKSGFSRIFKAACMCRDVETIHGHIAKDEIVEPSAKIVYANSKPDETYEWNKSAQQNPELQTVHIFDSRSARIHLSAKNEVMYVPAGLDIFDKLATVFNDVCEALEHQEADCRRSSPDFDLIFADYSGTPIYELLQNLDGKEKVEQLKKLIGLSEQETTQLAELRRQIKDKEANHPSKRREILSQKNSRFAKVHNTVAVYQRKLNQGEIDKICKAKSVMLEAEKLASAAKKKTFDESYLDGTGDPLWNVMWTAAKEYSEQSAYHDHEFPNTNDGAKCVLCQQLLPGDAAEKMRGFKDFVNDRSQEVARKSRETYENLLEEFADITVQDRETLTEVLEEMAADELPFASDISKLLEDTEKTYSDAYGRLADEKDINPIKLPEIDFTSRATLRTYIVEQRQNIEKFDITKFTQDLNKQKQQAFEFEARLELEKYSEAITKEIENQKRLTLLKSCIQQTDTTGVSRKGGELTTRFLGETLKNTYADQLKQLNRKGLIVELKKSHVEKGVAYSEIVISPATGGNGGKFKPDEIMSESEQKVASLAGFFTELSLAPHKSAIILDDPVTSLDEKNTARIAERIVKEAGNRQVIVFTHNLFFTAELINYADKHNTELTPRTVSKAKYAGQVIDDLPWQALSTRKRIARINEHLQELRTAFNHDEVAVYEPGVKVFYNSLRETWERAVEEILFKDAVKRYSRSVETQKLKQIRLEPGDIEAVDENMTQCSFYAHTNPPGVDSVETPEPDQLQEDLQKLKDWKSKIESRK
jgi:hypothetical protein